MIVSNVDLPTVRAVNNDNYETNQKGTLTRFEIATIHFLFHLPYMNLMLVVRLGPEIILKRRVRGL